MQHSSSSPETDKPARYLAWLYLVAAIIGELAASTLLIEKVKLLADPAGYVPTCSFNPVLSCGSVMTTPQAELFGFPNPILGVASFAVIATIGAAMLAGATFARWFWLGLQVGATLGAVFITWLMWQSLYSIGALCPYCMVVWAVTIPIFVYTTVHNINAGNLGLSKRISPVAKILARYHAVVVTAWVITIVSLILVRFWYYWSTLV